MLVITSSPLYKGSLGPLYSPHFVCQTNIIVTSTPCHLRLALYPSPAFPGSRFYYCYYIRTSKDSPSKSALLCGKDDSRGPLPTTLVSSPCYIHTDLGCRLTQAFVISFL